MKFKKHNQMVKHKLVSFACVIPLWTLTALLIKLMRILLKWKYIKHRNYAILTSMLQKQSYFVKKFSSRSPDWSVHMGKFSFRSPRSRSQKPVTRQARLLIWTHRNFYEEKSDKARSRTPSQSGWLGSCKEALRLILARAAWRELKWALRRAQNIFMPKNINSITDIITLEGSCEKTKSEKNWQQNRLSNLNNGF